MRFINRKTLAIAGVAAALVAAGSAGTAVAGSLIGSSDIQDESIRSVDIKDGSVKRADLSPKVQRMLAKHATNGTNGTNGTPGTPGQLAGVQTNWVASTGSQIVDKRTLVLANTDPAGTSVEIENLNLAVQAQQTISFTYKLNNGAVYGGGTPRVFVEMQGTYINTFDGDPADAGVNNGDGTFTKTVTIGKNGRIAYAGVVKDFGTGSVTITDLTIAGKVLDFK